MNTVNQSWPLAGGQLTVRVETPEPLSAAAMAALGKLMEGAAEYAKAVEQSMIEASRTGSEP